jgi:Polysaccharide biosynthesis enzyme WcbI
MLMLVYVHGNCQARAIAEMLAPVFPQWDVAYYEVFQQNVIDEIERYHTLVADADVIIAQPIHRGYRDRDDLSLEWVRSAAKPGTPVVTFPSMYFGGQLVGWTILPIPDYEMRYHDTMLVKLALSRLTIPEITKELLSPTLYSEAFIATEIELSIAELRRREREDAVDVLLSPFLERFGMQVPLFHVVNHPCRPALAYVASGILGRLGYMHTVPETGEDHIRYPHIPCSPSVERFFARRRNDAPMWRVQDGGRYQFPKESLDPQDYIAGAVNQLRGYTNEILQSCVDDNRAKPFLARAKAAEPGLRNPISLEDRAMIDEQALLATLRNLEVDLRCLIGEISGAKIEPEARPMCERIMGASESVARLLRT